MQINNRPGPKEISAEQRYLAEQAFLKDEIDLETFEFIIGSWLMWESLGTADRRAYEAKIVSEASQRKHSLDPFNFRTWIEEGYGSSSSIG